MPQNTLFSYYTELPNSDLARVDHPIWGRCEPATIDKDWRGRPLIREKGHNWKNLTRVASVWDSNSIFFRFQCWFDVLQVPKNRLAGEREDRQWETDVVAVFLRPESSDDYFEIEISALGNWLDAHIRKPRVDVDFTWASQANLHIEILENEKVWVAVVGIPFRSMLCTCSFLRAPHVGDVWRLNLHRMVCKDTEREFLSWRPTFTRAPDFHVPSAFGNLLFLEGLMI